MAFYVVYIREAHTSDVWQDPDNLNDHVVFASPKNFGERSQLGQVCVAKLGIKFPATENPDCELSISPAILTLVTGALPACL